MPKTKTIRITAIIRVIYDRKVSLSDYKKLEKGELGLDDLVGEGSAYEALASNAEAYERCDLEDWEDAPSKRKAPKTPSKEVTP